MSEPREPLYKSGWLSEQIAEVVATHSDKSAVIGALSWGSMVG
jgi:hypothetical protein